MPIQRIGTEHINRLESEIAEQTYVPFKIGKIVNGVPVWLEAQIPFSTNLEETQCICETIKCVFNETVELLEETVSKAFQSR